MRKQQKKQTEDFVNLLGQAHDEIRRTIETKEYDITLDLLAQCQEGAVELGNLIEQSEGEGFVTVSYLEAYCEIAYEIHEQISRDENVNADDAYQNLQNSLTQINNSIQDDIKIRYEIVFLPYKAAMWDSLESVWMAADADPECDAYVVPIPYYERNADGTLGTYHYEGEDMPEYVPVTHFNAYNLAQRHPDAIYIHNPYDGANYVTTIDPRYYSKELKKYTDLLIYIPYYATSGGMGEGQALCSAYLYADYIVVQSEKMRDFFDSSIPDEKFLPLGSPKFDKVIRLCKNPPEPPIEWKDKLTGKKVYFYNTSISGMLSNTEVFLNKMEYVFDCFKGRTDACLLWRPHPLLESTFDSMRKRYRPRYEELKKAFIDNSIGIYDDTPDIEKTIALCYAYVGDTGTSVTSLFGVVGKPLFILNNYINTPPKEDDWRGEIIKGFPPGASDDWMITQGTKLYHAPNHDYQYEYYCDLSKYTRECYYLKALEIKGKVYICPWWAQDILEIADHRVIKKIDLGHKTEEIGAFINAWNIGDYIFLIPLRYPAIVRYNIKNNKVDYIQGYNEHFAMKVDGEWRFGGSCAWKQYLFIASPTNQQVLAIDSETMKVQVLTTGAGNTCGCFRMIPDKKDLWLLPYVGTTITRWNPETGDVKEYSNLLEGLQCKNRILNTTCDERPFVTMALLQKEVILSPFFGNMFIKIDKETGTIEEWNPPVLFSDQGKNGYFLAGSMGSFLYQTNTLGEETWRFYCNTERKLYDINMETNEYQEVPIVFSKEELQAKTSGFGVESEWHKYCCTENAFNSISDFLDGKIDSSFDKEKQLQVFECIATNIDGTSGEKIHKFSKEKMQERG